jgi:hypothetical protein
MKYLKSMWAERIPNYDSSFQQIFDVLANKGNEGEREDNSIESGKVFSTQYELYIYAFFIGLYSKQQIPTKSKASFGHKISEWGKKNRKSGRESFIEIQDFIFIALVAKSDIDFVELEKANDENVTKIAVTNLTELLESYTNAGLHLIKDKLDDNNNYFISSVEAPLNFFLKSR